MKKILVILACIISVQAVAQDLMCIKMKNGISYEFAINNVKDMNFFFSTPIDVVGEWIIVSNTLLTSYDLKKDGTLKRMSFSNKSVLETTGTYTFKDNVLTLYFSGTTLVIPIVESSETKIVSTSGDTYYRVQDLEYNISTNDAPIHVGEEKDMIKYVDNCIIGAENNLAKPLKDGRGYAIVESVETQIMKAYAINVSLAQEYTDWAKYFKKTKDEIKADLGDPTVYPDEKSMTYNNFNADILAVRFNFDESSGVVTKVNVYYYNDDKRQYYCDYIETNYILNESESTTSRKVYYDAEDKNKATIRIDVSSTTSSIVYTDLKTAPIAVVDWTQYFKKTGDQIKEEFGSNPNITDDDEYEDYAMTYYNCSPYKYITFSFDKGFENVTKIMVSFNDASSMQNYCEYIKDNYILDVDDSSETMSIYYDTNSRSTASVRIIINSSRNYISYLDMKK